MQKLQIFPRLEELTTKCNVTCNEIHIFCTTKLGHCDSSGSACPDAVVPGWCPIEPTLQFLSEKIEAISEPGKVPAYVICRHLDLSNKNAKACKRCMRVFTGNTFPISEPLAKSKVNVSKTLTNYAELQQQHENVGVVSCRLCKSYSQLPPLVDFQVPSLSEPSGVASAFHCISTSASE